jgi:hypothetical protein
MKRLLKWSIWAYLLLWIFEGALRKWVLPGAQEAILIIRDPLLIGIYLLALASGKVPRNAFLGVLAALILFSGVFAVLAGQSNILVTIYGLRTNYLHVPLIWVMAETLDRKDVEQLGSGLLLLVLPMVAVMMLQFRAPMDAWINRGVGGDEVGQIYGAAGRIRPPGFFSFITGPMVFFPLAASFFLYQATLVRRLWFPVLLAVGVAIAIALPISISRGCMLATVAVGGVYIACMFWMGRISVSLIRFAATGFLLMIALSFLPIFKTARTVFMDRWNTAAAESEGNAWGSLTDRVLSGFTQPFETAASAPIFGYGIGVGSNVGARLLSGKSGFLLAEDEWTKDLLELGPMLGTAFLLYRAAITGYLFLVALGALLRKKDPLPMAIWAAVAPAMLLYQWAPPTLLGFSVFGSGLLLAANNDMPVEDDEIDVDADEIDDEDSEEETDEDDDEDTDDSGEAGPDEEVEEPSETLTQLEIERRRMRGL